MICFARVLLLLFIFSGSQFLWKSKWSEIYVYIEIWHKIYLIVLSTTKHGQSWSFHVYKCKFLEQLMIYCFMFDIFVPTKWRSELTTSTFLKGQCQGSSLGLILTHNETKKVISCNESKSFKMYNEGGNAKQCVTAFKNKS